MSSTSTQENERLLSKSKVKRASNVIKSGSATPQGIAEARSTVQQWRQQNIPATQNCFEILLDCSKQFDHAVATYRMKRLTSILDKINRPDSNYDVSTMDDIGGCRLILENMDEVNKAKEILCRMLADKKITVKLKDYIEKPKNSGYRSCHLLVRPEIGGLSYRVEIQIRTRLQHCWSTTVEIFDEIANSHLKSPKADESEDKQLRTDAQEFFQIASKRFAAEEHHLQNNNIQQINSKLQNLQSGNKILGMVEAACDDVLKLDITEDENKDSPEIYLLIFSKSDQVLLIKGFTSANLKDALEKYTQLEEEMESVKPGEIPPFDNVVLVHAKDPNTLAVAFPNYNANAQEFVNKVREFLGKSS